MEDYYHENYYQKAVEAAYQKRVKVPTPSKCTCCGAIDRKRYVQVQFLNGGGDSLYTYIDPFPAKPLIVGDLVDVPAYTNDTHNLAMVKEPGRGEYRGGGKHGPRTVHARFRRETP